MKECPVCKKRMRITKCYNVNIDICNQHGIWLDKGELTIIRKSILAQKDTFAPSSITAKLKRLRQRKDAVYRGRLEGTAFGIFSFLFPY